MERGNSKKIYKYIMSNHRHLIEQMGFEMKPADSPIEEIEVTKYPSGFMEFMTGKGYCNRDIYSTYSACDVLSYVVMAQERLFDLSEFNMEVNEAIGEKIEVAKLYGRNILDSESGYKLYQLALEKLETRNPVLIDFTGVNDLSFDFALNSIGMLYKSEDHEKLARDLILVGIGTRSIEDKIYSIRRNILDLKRSPNLIKIATFLS